MDTKILWVDDEVELLKPHILFLKNKGYIIDTCNNGYDAIEAAEESHYDLIILDEMMPGMTGLETLPKLKDVSPTTPIVMVTKSEEEDIMDRAVGAEIADYLIKPVNPNQVLLSIKKNVHKQELYDEVIISDYRSQFNAITDEFNSADSFDKWSSIYKKLVNWDIQLSNSTDNNINEILSYQKTEANAQYVKFIKKNYLDWLKPKTISKPVLSHTLMKTKVFPVVDKGKDVVFLLIDNFRYDQWLSIRQLFTSYFNITKEDFYCAGLPTATQYVRNSIFSGLTPLAMEKLMPNLWLNENEEGGKNQYEEDFLLRQLQTHGKGYKVSFDKLVKPENARKLLDNISRLKNNNFSVIVYNFLDILSHARTDTELIRELAEDEHAFRSLTASWFEHSELFDMIKQISAMGKTLIITSDHGTIQANNPVKIIGEKDISANLRYKTGRKISYNPKDVFEITNPEEAALPSAGISSRYIFACNNDFFAYPNNYNHYVKYYKGTFQHGGVSMEEMIVPFIILDSK